MNEDSGAARSTVGLVVPLFRSWNHIEPLARYVNDLAKRINGPVTLTLVVDGCERSLEAFRKYSHLFGCDLRVVVLSRNFGVGPALRAAMLNQSESFTIAFGSDLQEPIELFVTFVDELRTGEVDFVFGTRISREDPFTNRIFSSLFWRLNKRLIFPDVPKGGFDVFGCNSAARECLVALNEHRTNITSQMLWVGFRRKFIPFARISRVEGKSTWSLRKRLGLFSDSFVAFSTKPLRLGLWMISLSGTMAALLHARTTQNLATGSVVGALFLTGAILIMPYISRFLDADKDRPTFIVREIFEIEETNSIR